ncbi:hypothetical protein AA310_12265 [Arthrobacter sp. YC-RL1]|nr:hypothetical protein AA310_12265 [Arthrobacter sp. YC-RL1]
MRRNLNFTNTLRTTLETVRSLIINRQPLRVRQPMKHKIRELSPRIFFQHERARRRQRAHHHTTIRRRQRQDERIPKADRLTRRLTLPAIHTVRLPRIQPHTVMRVPINDEPLSDAITNETKPRGTRLAKQIPVFKISMLRHPRLIQTTVNVLLQPPQTSPLLACITHEIAAN